jgi:diguanylate cyclase (GGDEF)-like protein
MNTNAVNLKDITVLYCEDEDDLRNVTGEVIKQFTKHVYLAENGKIGFDTFLKYQDEIDLIVTDVNMPELNGLEMARKIKEVNPNIPIIVATAFSNSSYLLEAIELGIDKYVLKPIDIKKLFSVMKQSLLYHELQDLYRDNLTHLSNRNALIKELKQVKSSIIALMDIDDFSIINELYGEENGDKLLVQFKTILQEYFPKPAYDLYRVGADKFVINVKNTEMTQDELRLECIDFIHKLDTRGVSFDNGSNINIGITVGIAKSSNQRTFENAQRVLNMAKKKFIQVMQYDETIHDTQKNFEENLSWVKKLKDGLFDGHFKAFFQPIVKSDTQSVYKYEALIRYIEDNGDVIPPFKFLPIAKKAKLSSKILKLMLHECLDFIKLKKMIVSVNVSFDDIRNKDTLEYIVKILDEHQEVSEFLHFELLETEEIEDFEIVRKFIDTVHTYGCKVGVDDFGAGYSNFNMLEALKVDFVKIDGSLIKSVDTDINQEIIVDTIASYAKRTGVETVAEFVSKESIYEKIKFLGITYAQGWHFGKAVAIEEIE